MLLVVDTNIIVNALLSNNENAKSLRLMDDIFNGVHRICVSSQIMAEYRDVLSRPVFHIPEDTFNELMAWFDKNALHIEPSPTTQDQAFMKDEDDRAFFDLAKCLNAKLITRNYKHYPVHELITLIDELY